MYLKEVYIKNFRSIKECKIALDNLTEEPKKIVLNQIRKILRLEKGAIHLYK